MEFEAEDKPVIKKDNSQGDLVNTKNHHSPGKIGSLKREGA
jgi:hypothetical protein